MDNRQIYTDDQPQSGHGAPAHARYRDDPASDDEDILLPPSASDSLRQVGMEDPESPRKPSWKARIRNNLPPRLIQYWHATATWVKGPDPPRIFSISPLFPTVQHAPIRLLDRYAPKKIHRIILLLCFYAAWLLAFSLIQWRSSFASEIPGYGAPVRLGCTAHYW